MTHGSTKKIRVIKKAETAEKTADTPSNAQKTPLQQMIDRRRMLMRELNKIEETIEKKLPLE